jgi:adenylate cyclase
MAERRFAISRLPWHGPVSGIACAVLCLALVQVPAIGGLDRWFFDGFVAWRGQRPAQANVVIVALDERSLTELSKPLVEISPELATAVDHLRAEGAAAIGIDMIVPADLAGRPELARGAEGDATRLGQAIVDAGNVVLAQWKIEGAWHETLPQWRLKHQLNPEPNDLGFVNVTEDDDYFFRRQRLYIRDGDSEIPHLALAMLSRAGGKELHWRDGRLWLGEKPIPLDNQQHLLVNFRGPPHSIPTISFHDVLAAARSHRSLTPSVKNALVIIGVTAPSQRDFHLTPYANNFFRYLFRGQPGMMSGSELNANILATIADEAYLTATHPALAALLVTLAGAALGWAYARLSLIWGLVLGIGFHFGWKAVGEMAFAHANLQLPVLPMLLLGVVAYAATFAVRWRRIREMLAVLNSSAVAEALEAGQWGVAIPAEERVVSVLFADIRNFTKFSEGQGPQHVVSLLNAYFSAIVPLIELHGGVLNQYMGDGMMVIFGAPQQQPDHALRAVEAAVAVVREVHKRQQQWAALGFPEMRVGVGIHSGAAIVGTVGSERRRDYTAIGDTVNTAARIEAENKRLSSEILISEATFSSLSPADRARLVCSSSALPGSLKGKAKEVLMYRIDSQPK